MYVCLCKSITDKDIRNAVAEGAESMRAVRDTLGVASQCGKCACLAREIIAETLAEGGDRGDMFFEVA